MVEFYSTQPDPLPETLPDDVLTLERPGDPSPLGGMHLKKARLGDKDRRCYYGEGWINGFFFSNMGVIAERIHWPSVPVQKTCGDKHFGADVRCALDPGHNGAHRHFDMYWVHPHEQARCEATTFCGGKKHQCDSAAGHDGLHDSGTGLTGIRWDGTKVGTLVRDRALNEYFRAAVDQLTISIGGVPVPEQPKTTYEFVAEQLKNDGCYVLPVGESFIHLEAPILAPCRTCSSPKAFRSAYCVYCAHSTAEGSMSAAEADRITAGAMLNEDSHPGIAAARARNEAALLAERPTPTKSSRQAALPHPWEAWLTPGWES